MNILKKPLVVHRRSNAVTPRRNTDVGYAGSQGPVYYYMLETVHLLVNGIFAEQASMWIVSTIAVLVGTVFDDLSAWWAVVPVILLLGAAIRGSLAKREMVKIQQRLSEQDTQTTP